jgi:hypothetical protein
VLGFKVVSMHVMSMYTSLLLYCLVVYTLHTWKIFVVFSCQLFIYFCTTFFFFGKFAAGLFPNLSCGWCEAKVYNDASTVF